MSFTQLTKTLIKDINDLNSFMKDNKIEKEIDVKNVVDNIIEKEKDYTLLKHNLENSKNNLDKNIELLKTKCNIEYKIYETLIDHKTKLNELKKKNNELDLPNIDNFTSELFNIENDIENETQSSIQNNTNTKNNEKKRMSGNILHEQLNAAIIARRGAVNGNDNS